MTQSDPPHPCYDIAVIGAGAAGCMAAIRASDFSSNIILIDKNDVIGKKILLTGNRRCNLTNIASVESFVQGFGSAGRFLKPAFLNFSPERTRGFFQENGLELKIEGQGKVFPVTNSSKSVIAVLERVINQGQIHCCFATDVQDIQLSGGKFLINFHDKLLCCSKKVIIATGGCAYAQTGSTGDGLRFAKDLGHSIKPISAALVPLVTKEAWAKDLQGVSLQNVRILVEQNEKRIPFGPGEMLFTHFGISGPLVLNLSGQIAKTLAEHPSVRIFLDVVPNVKEQEFEKWLCTIFAKKNNHTIDELIQTHVPKKMAKILLANAGIDPRKMIHQITKKDRRSIAEMLKELPLTVTGCLPLENAMVSDGGIAQDQINPKTMESKLVSGLYFAGETIEGRGPSGGYNLQQAFSTGFLAGESAGKSLKDKINAFPDEQNPL